MPDGGFYAPLQSHCWAWNALFHWLTCSECLHLVVIRGWQWMPGQWGQTGGQALRQWSITLHKFLLENKIHKHENPKYSPFFLKSAQRVRPATLASSRSSSSASWCSASADSWGAPGKQIRMMLMLSKLPCKKKAKRRQHMWLTTADLTNVSTQSAVSPPWTLS